MVRKAAKPRKKARRRGAKPDAFTAIAMHVTEPRGAAIFAALKAERPTAAAFSLPESRPGRLDPESAAKRILEHALASDTAPSLIAPKVGGRTSEFRSLGVETVPLTGTTIVKFRQYIEGIPVYSSLVAVELDANNDMVSLHSNVATPDVPSYLAKLSPLTALKRIAWAAGYGRKPPQVIPALNLFLDDAGKWQLAYVAENVRSLKKDEKGPLTYDYVVDAFTGAIAARLPRTAAASTAPEKARDEHGRMRSFGVAVEGKAKVLRDAALNIETYDFAFADPHVQAPSLPGRPVVPSWPGAAVSAHANAAAVVRYLRKVLKRNNIDNKGGRVVSSINCVVAQYASPRGSRVWPNAYWNGTQMVYGQVQSGHGLRSFASSLDIVAHELFHGVIASTARLIYCNETGALNESYADIFGALISNFSKRDIARWDWRIGEDLESPCKAFRDLSNPPRYGQPSRMKGFQKSPNSYDGDFGSVHANCGIHNFAAYRIMTAKAGDGAFLFKPKELAAIFYVAVTQHLSRQSTFADSRRGVMLATRSLFRKRSQAEIGARVAAVAAGFDAAGIK